MSEADDLEAARAAQRDYEANYRATHREQIRQTNKKWRENNPDKVRQYNLNHWLKKAAEKAAEENSQDVA